MKKAPTIEVTAATKTSELVAYWNEHCGKIGRKPVKKFANRKTAEQRVDVLLDELEASGKLASPDESTTGGGTNSAGISASWQDKDVAAKRKQRSAVTVDGVKYGSVRKAYLALGMDLKDHIQFRMLLKETGKQKVDGRVWKIVPLNYEG